MLHTQTMIACPGIESCEKRAEEKWWKLEGGGYGTKLTASDLLKLRFQSEYGDRSSVNHRLSITQNYSATQAPRSVISSWKTITLLR